MAYDLPVLSGIKNLLIGLWVTLRHLFSHAITLQYPTERWRMPERSRGVVVLLSNKETGELNCTACMLCAKACPCAAIMIERHRGDDKKWKVDSFSVDNSICCYCGLCEEACNFDAIKLTPKYEFSTYDKPSLTYDMHRLQELGRDVAHTPRVKKVPAAAAPAAIATTEAGGTAVSTVPKAATETPTNPSEKGESA
jgi:NADH-quinone oxidoreductase subunit I